MPQRGVILRPPNEGQSTKTPPDVAGRSLCRRTLSRRSLSKRIVARSRAWDCGGSVAAGGGAQSTEPQKRSCDYCARACSDEVDPSRLSPAGLTRGSIIFAKGWIAPKSNVFDFGTLSAPKSGTPDFGVKPGNDSGRCFNFIGTCAGKQKRPRRGSVRAQFSDCISPYCFFGRGQARSFKTFASAFNPARRSPKSLALICLMFRLLMQTSQQVSAILTPRRNATPVSMSAR